MTTSISRTGMAQGDDDGLAFEALYRAEYGRVVGIARRILGELAEAEDVAQEAFAELSRRRTGSGSDGTGWLYAATAHRALNVLRTRKRRSARERNDARLNRPLSAACSYEADPALAVLRDETRSEVAGVFRRLPERDAVLLALRYGGELPYREIAGAVGVPVAHVGTLLARAERAFVREARGRWSPARCGATIAALALAAAVTVLAIAPLRAYATAIILALKPSRIVLFLTEPRGTGRLQVFEQLWRFSRVRSTLRKTSTPYVETLAEARRRSGLHVRVPSIVPDGLDAQRTQYVEPAGAVTITLDAARAARFGGAPLPRSLAGASIEIALQPQVQVRYGHGRVRDRIAGFGMPTVVIDELAVPDITVRGTTLARIADWFATQPSVPAVAVKQMRELSDPFVALPVPVHVDRERAARVRVDGVDGYAVTSILAGSSFVVWVKDGMAYAVGGTYPLERVLRIADSMR